MSDVDIPDPKFDAMTARLLRRQALRHAAEEMNTTSGPGLEGVLARISAELTAEAPDRHDAASGKTQFGVTRDHRATTSRDRNETTCRVRRSISCKHSASVSVRG